MYSCNLICCMSQKQIKTDWCRSLLFWDDHELQILNVIFIFMNGSLLYNRLQLNFTSTWTWRYVSSFCLCLCISYIYHLELTANLNIFSNSSSCLCIVLILQIYLWPFMIQKVHVWMLIFICNLFEFVCEHEYMNAAMLEIFFTTG